MEKKMMNAENLIQDHERDLCSRILAGQTLSETERAWLSKRLAAARARAEAAFANMEATVSTREDNWTDETRLIS